MFSVGCGSMLCVQLMEEPFVSPPPRFASRVEAEYFLEHFARDKDMPSLPEALYAYTHMMETMEQENFFVGFISRFLSDKEGEDVESLLDALLVEDGGVNGRTARLLFLSLALCRSPWCANRLEKFRHNDELSESHQQLLDEILEGRESLSLLFSLGDTDSMQIAIGAFCYSRDLSIVDVLCGFASYFDAETLIEGEDTTESMLKFLRAKEARAALGTLCILDPAVLNRLKQRQDGIRHFADDLSNRLLSRV